MPGCEYGGNVYPPGADIPELRGKSGSWCYGAYCSQGFGSNSIIHWDDFNCGVKTSFADKEPFDDEESLFPLDVCRFEEFGSADD